MLRVNLLNYKSATTATHTRLGILKPQRKIPNRQGSILMFFFLKGDSAYKLIEATRIVGQYNRRRFTDIAEQLYEIVRGKLLHPIV